MTEHEDNCILYRATSIAIDERAILICGASGVGKSALAMIMLDRGAFLISDDQTQVYARGHQLFAEAAPNITGKIEVRNLGVLEIEQICETANIALITELSENAPRYIDEPDCEIVLGMNIPKVRIFPDLATAPVKLEYALQRYGLKA